MVRDTMIKYKPHEVLLLHTKVVQHNALMMSKKEVLHSITQCIIIKPGLHLNANAACENDANV